MSKDSITNIINWVNELQCYQNSFGHIIEDLEKKKAKLLLENILDSLEMQKEFPVSKVYLDALKKDINNFIESDFKDINFDYSVKELMLPVESSHFVFLGPLRLANGFRKGWRMEFFISFREEPQSPMFQYMYDKYPHPKNICQSSKLLYGSSGVLDGNNIVFFPENVKNSLKLNNQTCAVFFFDKFYKIYNDITLPLIKKIGLLDLSDSSYNLDALQNYEARCVWGYLHDYYHHKGTMPFDENISLKTYWYAGVIEEIKVDLQTILTVLNDKKIPMADAVFEFILFDRFFRYTQEYNAYNNFDSATSFFLIAFFSKYHAFTFKENTITIDFELFQLHANELIKKIESIELSNYQDTDKYRLVCKNLFYSILNEPSTESERYGLPDELLEKLQDLQLV